MRALMILTSALALSATPATAQAALDSASPVGVTEVAVRVLAGGLGAAIGSVGLAYVGGPVLGPHGGEDPEVVGTLVGFGMGILLGGSLGVHLASRRQGYGTSYGSALGGALLGALALVPLAPAVHLDLDNAGAWLLVYGAPIGGAVAATVLQSHARSRSRARLSFAPIRGGMRLGAALSF